MRDRDTGDARRRPASPSGDSIGDLLRLADAVPEISGERVARHKAVARSRWERKVRARKRRRLSTKNKRRQTARKMAYV